MRKNEEQMTHNQIQGVQLWQWYQQAKAAARTAEIDLFEVNWLLQELSDVDPLKLRLGSLPSDSIVHLKQPWSEITQLWQQRLQQRIPIQYLVGVTHWRYFTLKVAPGVLIPRPETELIIEIAVSATETNPQLRLGHWVDLGTGSGAIALGLAEVFPQAEIHAVDESLEAVAIAQTNAKQLQLEGKINFYHGSWWQPLTALQGKCSGMVSNPPYIPSPMITTLQPEVALHEPHLALDGGEDGLDAIRHLVETAPLYLKSGGIWLIEMMAGQGQQVVELLHQQGSYTQIQVMSDLAGLDRFVLAYKR
jgi:release factor glutamine methyltransferase